MENQRIIYPNGVGGVAVITPSPFCGLTLAEIIARDVPAGSPWRVIDVSELPVDRTSRNAWEWEE